MIWEFLCTTSPAAPAQPAVGGPPVGLGGPGNLAALNKKVGGFWNICLHMIYARPHIKIHVYNMYKY